jgi:hypothetical protein
MLPRTENLAEDADIGLARRLTGSCRELNEDDKERSIPDLGSGVAGFVMTATPSTSMLSSWDGAAPISMK